MGAFARPSAPTDDCGVDSRLDLGARRENERLLVGGAQDEQVAGTLTTAEAACDRAVAELDRTDVPDDGAA